MKQIRKSEEKKRKEEKKIYKTDPGEPFGPEEETSLWPN
jgi:hypothetical protein